MTCSFVQIRVDLAKKPDTAAAELEKQLQSVTPQDIAATCKGQRKDMSALGPCRRSRPGGVRRAESTVHVSSVADLDDGDGAIMVDDLVKDAVVSLAYTIKFVPAQFFGTRRPRLSR